MKKYTYKVFTYNFGPMYSDDNSLENKLERFGKEGWELVSALPMVEGQGSDGDVSVSSDEVKFIFKQEI
ncbi:DUF4177 domain-containing protein [Bacillus velezensis]|uniref:DUF4177 domain-containing protein n=1 Tax=Bacillus TaxID=1386 RepID=UPI000447885F|nr:MULTISPECIES: DUF4177 domain-containing protein [Bacillus amyloliquefaciens group]EYB35510.1 hypothetical protein AW26_0114930 [Bacillus amyloliquefaciens EBL11]MDH3122600.1 DUF4177 domain-containing protein [Bacillus velezensis]MEC0927928.1 DUF4177 domain-containing protein [Bacillus velezensis]MEC0972296.1 DUF4177 domain-containing protein [Bacillus velezensis]NYZ56463.1 DUF4177 domain-containing protein [Bacillus amyloliquefaciens]